jgi:DNA polymerase (family 10)
MYNYKDLVEVFNELAKYEFEKRGRVFPGRAFKNSAKMIEESNSFTIQNGIVFLNNGKLGNSSSEIFIDYINNGYSSRLINYRDEYGVDTKVSDTLFDKFQKISGIGPVKAKILSEKYKDFSFTDIINNLPKVGEYFSGTNIKFTEMMKTGVEIIKLTNGQRLPWNDANKLANSIIYGVKNLVNYDFYVYKLGSLRRQKSTVGDIDLVVSNYDESNLDEIRKLFKNQLDSILVEGQTKIAGIKNGFQVDIRFIEKKYLGCMILHGTGSSEFNIKLRALAKSMGLRLNEYCIIKDEEEIYFNDEMEVFKYLNIKYVPPRYR